MRIAVTSGLAVLAMCTAARASAPDDWARADAQARKDASAPETLDWFSTRMQPSVSDSVNEALEDCRTRLASGSDMNFDLILVLDRQGRVQRSLWHRETPLTACMEPLLRADRYPAGPRAQVHVGIARVEVSSSPVKRQP